MIKVSKNSEIKASLQLEPFAELKVLCSSHDYAMVQIRAIDLPKFVRIKDLHISETESEPDSLLVLDANGAWLLEKDKVVCYQAAKLIYGKSVFESVLKSKLDVNCFVIFNGKYHKNTIRKVFENSNFGTSTTRLEIAESWQDVKIVSDVFVIQTWRGYAPVILVENKSNEIMHIIVGAKSFSSGLELIRKTSGQIINENISVRKLGEARTSLYEVIHRKAV
jgi:hypothetical protein